MKTAVKTPAQQYTTASTLASSASPPSDTGAVKETKCGYIMVRPYLAPQPFFFGQVPPLLATVPRNAFPLEARKQLFQLKLSKPVLQ